MDYTPYFALVGAAILAVSCYHLGYITGRTRGRMQGIYSEREYNRRRAEELREENRKWAVREMGRDLGLENNDDR